MPHRQHEYWHKERNALRSTTRPAPDHLPPTATKRTAPMTVILGLSLAEVTDSMEISRHFVWIILREVERGVCRDIHQAISLLERNPQCAGPRSLDATVEILPLRLKASQPVVRIPIEQQYEVVVSSTLTPNLPDPAPTNTGPMSSTIQAL